MTFNSWSYVLFLAFAIGIHWLLPHRYRILVLSSASLLFYSLWRWEFSLLVIFSAWIDFNVGHRIFKADRRSTRRAWLVLSLVVNIGLLLVFKYTYFIHDQIRFLSHLANPNAPVGGLGIQILLPLGISFYTFQTISYSIDVYRKVIQPERNFLYFATFVGFWPQLVAGPILRAHEVIPQLRQERHFNVDEFTSGLTRVLMGLFKKCVIADNLARIADRVFGLDPNALSGYDVWAAAFIFGFQIYFDFAGYSDIAIGSARALGIKFPENFNFPYMARTPKDFWKRWHISLSSWIRDYLYLPLTGQKFLGSSAGGLVIEAGRLGRTKALFLTWLIMGFWHGAGWNFALWGLYHAGLIMIYRWLPAEKWVARAPIGAWVFMLCSTMLGWIFFRAQSLSQIQIMLTTLLNPFKYGPQGIAFPAHLHFYLLPALLVGSMALMNGIIQWKNRGLIPRKLAIISQGMAISIIVFLVLVYLAPVRQFIYFQF